MKRLKIILFISLVVFIIMNGVAYMHAKKFTHFDSNNETFNSKIATLSTVEKLKAVVFGVNIPKTKNAALPNDNFTTINIPYKQNLEAWLIPTKNKHANKSKGTIVLFHGYLGSKSNFLDKVPIFDSLGFDCLLVDFNGAGGSEGNTCTIGYHEANQVKAVFDYISTQGEKNIYLYGTSMGAVAIMKAVNEYKLPSKSLILECPFGTMYETVAARFKTMGIPKFPMVHLLVFWGGAQNNFNAFSHKPTEYAIGISLPTLLMYGAKDETVSMDETMRIYKNLSGPKTLKIFENAGHENYLKKYKEHWIEKVAEHLLINSGQ